MAIQDYFITIKDYAMKESVTNYLSSSFTEGIIALGILFIIILAVALYVYIALAWHTIARKVAHPRPWLAWIPFANISLMLQLGRFSWAWVFLILVPILGWLALLVLLIVANWRTFEDRNYQGWFSLGIIIPKIGFILYLITIGIVAWKDKSRK